VYLSKLPASCWAKAGYLLATAAATDLLLLLPQHLLLHVHL